MCVRTKPRDPFLRVVGTRWNYWWFIHIVRAVARATASSYYFYSVILNRVRAVTQAYYREHHSRQLPDNYYIVYLAYSHQLLAPLVTQFISNMAQAQDYQAQLQANTARHDELTQSVNDMTNQLADQKQEVDDQDTAYKDLRQQWRDAPNGTAAEKRDKEDIRSNLVEARADLEIAQQRYAQMAAALRDEKRSLDASVPSHQRLGVSLKAEGMTESDRELLTELLALL